MAKKDNKKSTKLRLSRIARRVWFSGAQVASETLASETKVYQIGLIYGVYRLLVAVFLILTNYTANEAIKMGAMPAPNLLSSEVEYVMLGVYLAFGTALFLVLFFWRHQIRRQLLIGFILDMVILTVLLYSGTVKDLQIVLLYMVATAASFMMLRLAHAMSITLIAILSLIFQQLLFTFTNKVGFLSVSDALMLSVSLFAVGFLSWSISQRLAVAEYMAYNNAKEIKRLNAINQEVIKNIVSGVIVIGRTGRLLIINQTAQELLRLPPPNINATPIAYTFEIERQIAKNHKELMDWYQYEKDNGFFTLTLPQQKDQPAKSVRIHKKRLPEHGQLLILEDVSREESHAQQLKLASLGQLSASIAHEIRNPLGAISQASELLMEDTEISSGNAELSKIIYNQTQRVNRIIEDVMRLSRQEPPKQQPMVLKTWLPNFVNQHYGEHNIALHCKNAGEIFFDPHHLEQIFINLINNGLRHTKPAAHQPEVKIVVHRVSDEVFVDVIDYGEGVNKNDLPNLFNPFFTKSIGGTGLGLYLSKAFSEANHAHLIYLRENQRTCFRLMIPCE